MRFRDIQIHPCPFTGKIMAYFFFYHCLHLKVNRVLLIENEMSWIFCAKIDEWFLCFHFLAAVGEQLIFIPMDGLPNLHGKLIKSWFELRGSTNHQIPALVSSGITHSQLGSRWEAATWCMLPKQKQEDLYFVHGLKPRFIHSCIWSAWGRN